MIVEVEGEERTARSLDGERLAKEPAVEILAELDDSGLRLALDAKAHALAVAREAVTE